MKNVFYGLAGAFFILFVTWVVLWIQSGSPNIELSGFMAMAGMGLAFFAFWLNHKEHNS